jgi:hypothetical protein
MNGALIGLWLAVAVGACGFNGESGDAPVGGDADGSAPDSDLGADAITPDAPDASPDASLCTPSATSCTGRVLTTCSADGSAITTTTCDLACSAGACFSASNLSSTIQQACMAAAPAIALTSGETAVIDRAASTSLTANGVVVPATLVPSTGLEPPLAVFCLGSLSVAAGARLVEEGPGDSNAAIALLVMGDVNVAGEVHIDGRPAGELIGGRGAMGGFAGADSQNDLGGQLGSGPCAGLGGARNAVAIQVAAGGGGGGGNGGLGGNGGTGYAGIVAGVAVRGMGGNGGMACTSPELVPLVGGSGGGSGADGECAAQCGHAGGGGGGAIQISAGGTVSITGVVSAEGGLGSSVGTAGDYRTGAAGGGGGGGSILVEGPTVSFGANTLRVSGGNGGASQAGSGGAGAMGMMNGGEGTDSSTQGRNGGAGGGGSAGRVRINTLASTVCGQAAVPAASCSAGVLTSQP